MAIKNGNVSSYQYVQNNPIRLIDPIGMDEFEPIGADGLTNSQWIVSSRPGGAWQKGDEKKFKQENKEKEREREKAKKDPPTLWIANAANLSTKRLISIINNAADIFAKNGITDTKYQFVDVEEAKKHSSTYDYQMFLAIVNNDRQSIGNSILAPEGRIGVYNEQRGWYSYINVGRSEIANHKNPNYAAGYDMAHEMLHQMLHIASYYKNDGLRWNDHNNSIPNLNMDGNYVTIPPRPIPNKLWPEETILPYQMEYLKSFYDQ